MGHFSYCRLDKRTEIKLGQKFKFLIPAAFGGGQFIAKYDDYGRMIVGENTYDIYELLANFNMPELKRGLTPISDRTREVRVLGIDLGCYDNSHRKLKYPLRLISIGTKGSYEDFDGLFSPGAPNQGMGGERYKEEMFKI